WGHPIDQLMKAYAGFDPRAGARVKDADINFTRYVGAVHVGTLKRDQGNGPAVVLEVPLSRLQELAVLGAQTALAIQALDHTFTFTYALTADAQSIRAYYFDTTVSGSDAETTVISGALSTAASVFWSKES